MATQAYYNWVRDGRPWKVAAPIKAIGDRLRAHGYTVYYLGSDDASHLQSDFPEDHCPFSFTGWPGSHPYPYVTAMDIMPPKAGQVSKLDGKPLPSLQQISAQMRADKIAGHAGMRWLKYMNWEPDGNNTGSCWHDSWQPSYARRASSDRGHTHMSGRTDYVTASNSYDPVTRVRGEDGFLMALSDAQQRHAYLMLHNLESLLVHLLTGAESRPQFTSKSASFAFPAQPIVPNRWLKQLLGGQVTDAEFTAALTELGEAVDQVDDKVLAGLGGTDAEVAEALTAVLGAEKAAAVGRLLVEAPAT